MRPYILGSAGAAGVMGEWMPSMGASSGRYRRQAVLISLIVTIVALAVGLAALKYRDTTNQALAHDPTKPRRQRVAYHETLVSTRYTNDDLKLTVTAPGGWIGALGARPEFAELPYEGLIVKFEKPGAEAPKPRPLFSLVLRAEGRETAPSAVEYARKHLLGPGKTLVREPEAATILGRPSCLIEYDLPSGAGALRIRQHVILLDRGALVLSSMADVESAALVATEIEAILNSMRLEL